MAGEPFRVLTSGFTFPSRLTYGHVVQVALGGNDLLGDGVHLELVSAACRAGAMVVVGLEEDVVALESIMVGSPRSFVGVGGRSTAGVLTRASGVTELADATEEEAKAGG